eukprot:Filipodium_phascolosomae@DN7881_c0_g1_i1.p2
MNASSNSTLVFVYGTLKEGFKNHFRMIEQQADKVCEALTQKQFPLYLDPDSRNRPCLVDIENVGERIFGEVYRVNPTALAYLDLFERVPVHYYRRDESVECCNPTGKILKVSLYFNRTSAGRINELMSGSFEMFSNYSEAHERHYIPRMLTAGEISAGLSVSETPTLKEDDTVIHA